MVQRGQLEANLLVSIKMMTSMTFPIERFSQDCALIQVPLIDLNLPASYFRFNNFTTWSAL